MANYICEGILCRYTEKGLTFLSDIEEWTDDELEAEREWNWWKLVALTVDVEDGEVGFCLQRVSERDFLENKRSVEDMEYEVQTNSDDNSPLKDFLLKFETKEEKPERTTGFIIEENPYANFIEECDLNLFKEGYLEVVSKTALKDRTDIKIQGDK